MPGVLYSPTIATLEKQWELSPPKPATSVYATNLDDLTSGTGLTSRGEALRISTEAGKVWWW